MALAKIIDPTAELEYGAAEVSLEMWPSVAGEAALLDNLLNTLLTYCSCLMKYLEHGWMT
jgi:hypothetical protein